jgi:peptidyl-prolyl cis-trans isomerase SurA
LKLAFPGILLSAVLARSEPVPINWLTALVNDVPITYKEIDERTADEERLLRYQYQNKPQIRETKVAQLKSDVLSLLIENQLILHEFKTAGYQLPQSIIDDYIRATIREEFGTRVAMIKTLADKGTTYEAYRKRLQEDYIIKGMIFKNVGGEILVSPYKIEKYYNDNIDKFKVEDMVKLRMIFLANKPGRDEAATKKFAEELREKITGGASFAEMAKAYSDGSQRSEGGDWREVYRKTLREDLAEVAFSLNAGELSDVLQRKDGCYLMLVEEKKAAHTKSLTEVRDEVEQILSRQEQQRAREQWMKRLKSKSFVEFFPPPG